jgi:alpha-L-rhamnosidase
MYDSIYNGETYDARLETPGWTFANFNDSQWAASTPISGPGGMLSVTNYPIKEIS